jgi:hypothetical protein
MTDQHKYEEDAQVQAIVKATPEICRDVENLQIDCPEHQSIGMQILKMIKDYLKGIKKKKEEYSLPMRKVLDDLIYGPANRFSEPLIEAKEKLEDKLRDFKKEQQAIKEKEDAKAKRKIDRAVENGNPVPVVQTPQVEKTIKTETTTGTYQDNWQAEVIDSKKFIDYCVEESRYDLLKVNEKELKNFAKGIKDSKVIPGIIIKNVEKISSR